MDFFNILIEAPFRRHAGPARQAWRRPAGMCRGHAASISTGAFGARHGRPIRARESFIMQKGKKIWMDGKLVDWDKANVHVLTHTLHYGLGVFEGIRCYLLKDGKSAVFRLNEHTDRLFASAHIAQIEMPFPKKKINRE